MGPSLNKVKAIIFWNARGVVYINYLEKGRKLNGSYYANLLDRFNEDLNEKTTIAKKKVLFHQNEHTRAVVMGKFHKLGYELLPHPPHLPDLAPVAFLNFLKFQ